MKPVFAVSSENLDNTSSNQNKGDSCDDNRAAEDLAQSSGEIIELVIEEGIENEEYLHIDDSLDEGLGDISSDETAESPVPNIETEESQDTGENGKCEQAHVMENGKERRPSRISLETPL